MYMNAIGFSLWCDFVERSFLEGEFVPRLTPLGVRKLS
jgi:hypothetical protein